MPDTPVSSDNYPHIGRDIDSGIIRPGAVSGPVPLSSDDLVTSCDHVRRPGAGTGCWRDEDID